MINIISSSSELTFVINDVSNSYPLNTLGYSITEDTITVFSQEVVCTAIYNEYSIDGTTITSIDDFKNKWTSIAYSTSGAKVHYIDSEIYCYNIPTGELSETPSLGDVLQFSNGSGVLTSSDSQGSLYANIYASTTFGIDSPCQVKVSGKSYSAGTIVTKDAGDMLVTPNVYSESGESISIIPNGRFKKDDDIKWVTIETETSYDEYINSEEEPTGNVYLFGRKTKPVFGDIISYDGDVSTAICLNHPSNGYIYGNNDTYEVWCTDSNVYIIYKTKTIDALLSNSVGTTTLEYYERHYFRFNDVLVKPNYYIKSSDTVYGEWVGYAKNGDLMKVVVNNSLLTIEKISTPKTWTVSSTLSNLTYTTFSASQTVSLGDIIKFNDGKITLTSSISDASTSYREFLIGSNENYSICYDTKLRYLYASIININTTLPTDLVSKQAIKGFSQKNGSLLPYLMPKTINEYGIPKAYLVNQTNTSLFRGGVYKDNDGAMWVFSGKTLYTAEAKSTSIDFDSPTAVDYGTFKNNGDNINPFDGLILLDKNDSTLTLHEVSVDSGKKYEAIYGDNVIFYITADFNDTNQYQTNIKLVMP